MAVFVMKDVTVTINGTDLSDHCSQLSVAVNSDAVDTTTFGNSWRTFTGGMKSGSVTLTFQADYAASKVNATVGPLLGSYATVVASGTLGGTSTAGTAVCFVSSVEPIAGAVGDLAVMNLTWETHGTVAGWGL